MKGKGDLEMRGAQRGERWKGEGKREGGQRVSGGPGCFHCDLNLIG